MIRKALLALAMLSLASTTALAAGGTAATVSKDRLKTMIPFPTQQSYVNPGIRVPGPEPIFSNIGTAYPKGLYFCCYGGTIGGPASQVGQVWQAEAFTPSGNFKVTNIDAAVGFVSGTNGVTIGLYADAGGIPGKKLFAKNVTGLGAFGGCCGLATIKSKNGIAITSGTQYWVVISTDKNTSTTWDAWNMNTTDQIDPINWAINEGSGWSGGQTLPAFSFDVLGDPA